MSAKKVNLTPMPQDPSEIDQDKLREEHLEAGRQDIMKALEGVPGAEKVAELMERGRKKGKLSSAELMENSWTSCTTPLNLWASTPPGSITTTWSLWLNWRI